MPSFQINAQDPPQGGVPVGNSYFLRRPVAKGKDGLGRPCGAVGLPWVEFKLSKASFTVWDWYIALVGTSEYVSLTSIQTVNPYKTGGIGWEEFTGDRIVMHMPTYEKISLGWMMGVKILIEGVN